MPINISSLSLADARRLIAAGEQKAQELGIPYNIAVVDAGGNLVATRPHGWCMAGEYRYFDPQSVHLARV